MPVNNVGRSVVAIFPPSLFGDGLSGTVTGPFIHNGQPTNPYLPPKGCSSTVLIMYNKESAVMNNAFEQQIQVNLESTQLEDMFKQNELALCVELWFAEENEK